MVFKVGKHELDQAKPADIVFEDKWILLEVLFIWHSHSEDRTLNLQSSREIYDQLKKIA